MDATLYLYGAQVTVSYERGWGWGWEYWPNYSNHPTMGAWGCQSADDAMIDALRDAGYMHRLGEDTPCTA